MSTRSYICRLNENGSVTGIYCHHDGYPDGVGKMLNENYVNEDKIDALFSLGDISSLGPGINDGTIAYARDRNDDLEPPTTYTTVPEMRKAAWVELGAEYSYVWNGSSWDCYSLFDH